MSQLSIVGRRACWWARRLAAVMVVVPVVACSASAGEPAAQRHDVAMTGFAFVPDTLRVAVGDTIVWTNHDVVPHTATDVQGQWDSGSLAAGASWRLVVESAATSSYLCILHPTMTATLIAE